MNKSPAEIQSHHQDKTGSDQTVNGRNQNTDKELMVKLQDRLIKLEALRLDKYAQYKARKKLSVVLATILTPVCGYIDWWLLMLQKDSDDGLAGLTVLLLTGLYVWVTQPKRRYVKEYKKDILPRLASVIGDLTYKMKARIPMEALIPSKIIPEHDRYKAEDYFEGMYKGVTLKFAEAELTERRGSGKRRRSVTVFKGLVILLDLPDISFNGHTVLLKDRAGIFEWVTEKAKSLQRADLVDPVFEDRFDVYTDDQVEARYLIDPIMIERLKTLDREYGGEALSAAWFDGRMLILIASQDNHFEPADLCVPALDQDSIMRLKREVETILDIIDYLQLHNQE